MKHMVSVDEVMAALPAERRTAIEQRGAELVKRAARRMTLGEVRKQRRVSQAAVAGALGIGQMQISRLERRSDPRLSTIERTIEALGGQLTLVATFPDQEPVVLVRNAKA